MSRTEMVLLTLAVLLVGGFVGTITALLSKIDHEESEFRTHCEKVVGGYAVQDLAGKYRCVMNAE